MNETTQLLWFSRFNEYEFIMNQLFTANNFTVLSCSQKDLNFILKR